MRTLLSHANAFDGEGPERLDDVNIVIEDDRVIEIGHGATTSRPGD